MAFDESCIKVSKWSLDAATRNKLADRVEVLDKVKKLFLLPQLEMMTAQQVANYYEVGIKAIQSCFYDNRDEIREDGVVKYTPKMLKNLNLLKGETEKSRYVTEIKLSDDVILRVPNAGINLFSKRAILRIGMLLRDSLVAREVRTKRATSCLSVSRTLKVAEYHPTANNLKVAFQPSENEVYS